MTFLLSVFEKSSLVWYSESKSNSAWMVCAATSVPSISMFAAALGFAKHVSVRAAVPEQATCTHALQMSAGQCQ